MNKATVRETDVLAVRKYGDPVLRRKAQPVKSIDDELRKLIRTMFHTMYAEPGIGLAAPQVGVPMRLAVVDLMPEGKSSPMVLINPKMEEKRGRVLSEEGCLSLPGLSVNIPRAEWVRVSALNESGFPITVSGDGLLARCLQHELDHLDGVLIIDHLPVHERLGAFWEIRKKKKAGLWK
ncbi:MAG: peptide deformylase [Elusimicrobia bacterium]|nr:peptide deformylase [Elusimicrobiota bacterium]